MKIDAIEFTRNIHHSQNMHFYFNLFVAVCTLYRTNSFRRQANEGDEGVQEIRTPIPSSPPWFL